MIFNKNANAWHTRYPEGHDALRVQVTPRTGSHMETLAFYFPVVDGKKAELALHWGTVVVPLKMKCRKARRIVQPSRARWSGAATCQVPQRPAPRLPLRAPREPRTANPRLCGSSMATA